MQIYLIRHAEAVPAERFPGSDADRPLTKPGLQSITDAAPRMAQAGVAPTVILSSPFKRALQTSAPLVKAFNARLIVAPELAAGASAETIRSAFGRLETPASLCVVGHMPDVALFASRATSIAAFLDRGFKPGEMAGFETPSFPPAWGASTLLWRRQLADWT